LAWIEAWDSVPLLALVETMRGLDLLEERGLAHYIAMILINKLQKVLEPPPPPPKPKRAYKKRRFRRNIGDRLARFRRM
jgi:hypothetical protein